MTSEELYKKHRPTSLDQVLGQPEAVKQLKGFLAAGKVPSSILFTGSPGTGKTTLARIMAKAVKAGAIDLTEVNAASARGIDDVREWQAKANLRSMSGGAKVLILDEAHKLTGDAQAAMLKMLEDVPSGQFYFLCTSNPEKISKAIMTRLTKIGLVNLDTQTLVALIGDVSNKEGFEVPLAEAGQIAKAAQGSARTALVTLDAYRHSGFDAQVLATLTETEAVPENIFNLCKLLMFGGTWANVYALANSLEYEGIEGVRHMILTYSASCMKDQKNCPKGLAIIRCFHAPFFDSKKPGFIAACYSAWSTKSV